MRVSSFSAVIVAGMMGLGCESNGIEPNPNPLPTPNGLSSISLNGAIHLHWTDNAALADPARFDWYQVYSTSYNLDQGLCATDWVIEGTTVSNEFLSALLENGVPLCFAVSAFTIDGVESEWSLPWQDTPRPDARNVLVSAFQADAGASGFRFWDDANGDGVAQGGELGLIQSGASPDIDFVVRRNANDSTLWIVPVFAGTSVRLYSGAPVADLTSIDFAPATGYARDSLLARPQYGYVFEIVDGAALHYAGLRATHVGRQYLIFDFSVQTDPGNPELVAPNRPPTVSVTGAPVTGTQ